MSDSTYSDQLDVLGAPPGDTITGRVLGLYQKITEEGAEERIQVKAAIATLTELGAPNEWTRKPYQNSATAPTIAERIRGLHLALTEAKERVVFEVKEARRLLSQHAPGDTLTDMARSLVERHTEALRQRDEQVLIRGRAQQAEAAALEALDAARHCADVTESRATDAERRAIILDREATGLRAENARLEAQLDYATDLLTLRRIP